MSVIFSNLVAARLVEVADGHVESARLLISEVLGGSPTEVYAGVMELTDERVTVEFEPTMPTWIGDAAAAFLFRIW